MTTHPSDAHHAHSIEQRNAAIQGEIAEALYIYGTFTEQGGNAAAALIAQANAARGLGIVLRGLKEKLRHGEFILLFSSANGRANEKCAFRFTAEWGRVFMRF